MNTILLNLVKTFDDDDLFEILFFITDELTKRGYFLYDVLSSINDNFKKEGE